MADLVHRWPHEGRTITFRWVGRQRVTLSRVYALAFTSEGELLLVGEKTRPHHWLPGGGVEPGESAEAALARELLEEAAATVRSLRYLGAQRVEDPLKPSEHHGFYWCRVQLAEAFVPEFETTERLLVSPERFLDLLFWGRGDPKGAYLLNEALRIDRLYDAP